MAQVEFERTFQAAHRLSRHAGKCSRIHGHNFHLTVTIDADRLGEDGFVIEFERVKELVDRFDHRLILEQGDPVGDGMPRDWLALVPGSPTTEFMAQWFADAIAELVVAQRGDITVDVETVLRETDSISARGRAER